MPKRHIASICLILLIALAFGFRAANAAGSLFTGSAGQCPMMDAGECTHHGECPMMAENPHAEHDAAVQESETEGGGSGGLICKLVCAALEDGAQVLSTSVEFTSTFHPGRHLCLHRFPSSVTDAGPLWADEVRSPIYKPPISASV